MAIDPTISNFDVRDPYQLTYAIQRMKNEDMEYNVPFAPMRPVRTRQVKLHISRYNGAGLSPFRAVNANTPVMPDTGFVEEQLIDLVNLAELSPLKEDELLYLESVDPMVRSRSIRNVVDRTIKLRQRNTNRSIWMAWKAVQDALVITYDGSVSITVSWDLAGASWNDWFTSSHLPTATTDWNAKNADGQYSTVIVDQLETWKDILAIDGGVVEEQIKMHVNSRTWRVIRENQWLKNQVSQYQPRDVRVTKSEAANALGIGEIVVMDPVWFDADSNTRYKHLDDGKALFTGPYISPADSAPIASMLDGPVVKVMNGRARVENNPGLQAEIWAQEDPPAENIRVQSARMVVLNHPEELMFATLWS